MSLGRYFFLFLIYSIIGWLMEGLFIFIEHKKIVNRGFLIGPYCPIYGIGGLLITLFLPKSIDPFSLFLKSMVICGFLEYFTGYLLEKIFHAKWWDYSNKKFNINGYICLENLVLFGVGACLIVYLINPFLIGFLQKIPNIINLSLLISLSIIFVIDIIISIKLVTSLKVEYKQSKNFALEGITTKDVKKMLNLNSLVYRRFMSSFPSINKLFMDLISRITK